MEQFLVFLQKAIFSYVAVLEAVMHIFFYLLHVYKNMT